MPKNKGLSPRDIRILVGFAIFAEAILGYFLLLDPVFSKIAREEQRLTRQQTTLREIQAMLYTPQATVSNDLPVYTEAHGRGPILFQQQLSDWISEDGNEISTIAVTPGQEKPLYQCHVSLLGSYANISRFMDRLERPPYLLGLNQVTINSKSEGGKLQADLDLTLPLAEP